MCWSRSPWPRPWRGRGPGRPGGPDRAGPAGGGDEAPRRGGAVRPPVHRRAPRPGPLVQRLVPHRRPAPGHRGDPVPAGRRRVRRPPAGGGVKADRQRYLLATHGAHVFDTVRFLLGEVASVVARHRQDGPDHVWQVLVTTTAGAVGTVTIAADVPGLPSRGHRGVRHRPGRSGSTSTSRSTAGPPPCTPTATARSWSRPSPTATPTSARSRRSPGPSAAVATPIPDVRDGLAAVRLIEATATAVETRVRGGAVTPPPGATAAGGSGARLGIFARTFPRRDPRGGRRRGRPRRLCRSRTGTSPRSAAPPWPPTSTEAQFTAVRARLRRRRRRPSPASRRPSTPSTPTPSAAPPRPRRRSG